MNNEQIKENLEEINTKIFSIIISDFTNSLGEEQRDTLTKYLNDLHKDVASLKDKIL